MSKYQICVSGAAKGQTVEDGKELARLAGVAIAKRGHSLLTGATTGLPNYAAIGAKHEEGSSIGLSPAHDYYDHVNRFKLPTSSYDVIFYTGMNFVGRDVMLIQSSDAVISIGGRIGTTHEFAVAMELGKPVGVLHGAGGTSELFEELLNVSGDAAYPQLVHGTDPDQLVAEIIKLLDERKNEMTAARRAHLQLEHLIP
ncbi:hypothetical protein KBC31_03510 [Candidatus Saccharibacteria bacterium]|jgi:uncharacterized protein (TIGR00725 family)|nr:hypothetical protein [Candidatus Saccharibacteria bacterium]